jgi:GT2 family glycosyltransferase
MKILVITVNYNNSDLTLELSKNIHDIFPYSDLYIVDNNSDEYNKLILNKIEYGTVIFNKKNSGYFQAINIILEMVNIIIYDSIIICNNDIIFDKMFYSVLAQRTYDKKIFAVSPRIFDMEGNDQNPMIEHKISRFKVFFYDVYFKNYYFGHFLLKTWKHLKKIIERRKNSDESRNIFMGYGAIYILTGSFFMSNKILDHPPFLMGEETFLAYQIYNTAGVIYYDKDLVVYHKDHSSCSKIPSKKMYLIFKESYRHSRSLLLKLPSVK